MSDKPEKAVDYSDMSLEELDALMRKGGDPQEQAQAEPEPEPEPAPQEEPAPESETEPAEAPEQQPEEKPEESPAESSDEDEDFDEGGNRFEQLQQELRAEKAARERMEMLHGLRAGETGHLKKKIKEMEKALAAQRNPADSESAYDTQEDLPTPAEPERKPAGSEFESRLAELESDKQQRAALNALQDFYVEHGMLDDKGELTAEAEQVAQLMAPIVDKQIKEYAEVPMSAKFRQKLSRNILDVAHAQASAKQLAERRAKYKERKASQVSAKRKEKLAASISGSSSQPSAQEKPTPPTLEEMKAELDRRASGG